jgi:hypothetical protein
MGFHEDDSAQGMLAGSHPSACVSSHITQVVNDATWLRNA